MFCSCKSNIGSPLVFKETKFSIFVASDSRKEHIVDFFSLPAIDSKNIAEVIL